LPRLPHSQSDAIICWLVLFPSSRLMRQTTATARLRG
jgi:hypothetical protein